MENDSKKRRRELETRIIEKVGEVITAVKNANHVDEVICALHSIASLLFPIDSCLLSGVIDQRYRDQVLSAKVPCANERDDLWRVFYQGPAFSTLARFLLLDVASNWLACFPFSARKHVYDIFFVNGLAVEVAQTLVPCLQQSRSDVIDINAIQSNVERLVVLCLLENNGVLQMAREFSVTSMSEDSTNGWPRPIISRVAQLVASVPDKAGLRAPTSLSSQYPYALMYWMLCVSRSLFFKQLTIQLLSGAEERAITLSDKEASFGISETDGTLLFVGETFCRICRRGSSDVLLREVISQIFRHVQQVLLSNSDADLTELFGSNPGSQVWSKIMGAIKDPYSVERMSELLLHQLASEHVTDVEAYWIIWLLFHQIFYQQTSVRSMFVDKFLLWKVFPVCCLRWILQFAVFGCPPVADPLSKDHETVGLIDTVQRLVAVWSKKEFVQSATMEQQASAVGLCLEKMSKEELDETTDVLRLILPGVSCRLESPLHLVRKMASAVALTLSKVIDPKNPLYLDDSLTGDIIDWEFGFTTEKNLPNSNFTEETLDDIKISATSMREEKVKCITNAENNKKGRKNKSSEYKLVDPDEIVDPATLNDRSVSDQVDDNASENSDSSSDSSLQPYDLSDDDDDLKRNFSQLVDVVGALRKSDDADGLERALDVAEKLVRASPDELKHLAGDLVRNLVLVRCSDLAEEGEEESAEEKRQRALVALVVTCPFESLDTLNKLLYSPNVDVSQRIMILDVMTEAAQELANSKTKKPKHQPNALISTISEAQSWFLPSSTGPPGAGAWKEVSGTGTLLNWSNCYERELPSKRGQIKKGKTRRWSLRSANMSENHVEWSHNKFPLYVAAFMLPAMQGFDRKRHGVDLLGMDFIVLGKLLHMLGVCIKCASMHPEASALAPALLDMLRSRDVCHHKEAYVRRAVLFAASCVLVAVHPSFVSSALVEGNDELCNGLEWVRSWALHVADSDTDKECYMLAMSCLQLHAEMALQASRALEPAESTFKLKSVGPSSSLSKGMIKIPHSNSEH
ncbi:Telomere reg-2 domain-containing protein [Citrus sinensis]|uniref:Telomere reg-2 domain-containing protein n=1 Tax=Citrus sinensis TaxID=2711 RepID=A0ACB8LTM8_CITSI|nr:Telomere reg-2 domain-containing protein [Citrus sinensis]